MAHRRPGVRGHRRPALGDRGCSPIARPPRGDCDGAGAHGSAAARRLSQPLGRGHCSSARAEAPGARRPRRARGRPQGLVRQGRPQAGRTSGSRRSSRRSGNATAFVVYVGSKGVMNWVEAEVTVALSRANADKGFHSGARRRQRRVERAAVLREALSGRARSAQRRRGTREAPQGGARNRVGTSGEIFLNEPFVGLRSMQEEESDRFGREAEVDELVEKFRRRRVVAIVADSGAGSLRSPTPASPRPSAAARSRTFRATISTTASGTRSRRDRAPIRKKACDRGSTRRRKRSASRRTRARACARG